MKIKEIIKHLEKCDPNDSLVIAWWDKDFFDLDLMNDPSLNWAEACNFIMDEVDWSDITNDIEYALQTFLKEEDAE